MSYLIRPAVPQDAAALGALGRTTFTETFGHLYSAENLSKFLSDTHNIEKVSGEIASPDVLIRVVEIDGELAGFCKLGLKIGLDYDVGDRAGMELKQLYLHSSAQGTGAANELMEWMLEEARSRDVQVIVLSVYSENIKAQRFYQRHGFSKFADTFFMVGDHRDEEFVYGLDFTGALK